MTSPGRNAFIVIGLGYGDEGKGSCVDWLVRKHGATLVVRFNGGAQAAHRVLTAEGQEHIFHMFGSGTLAGARTHLSGHVLVNPEIILHEAGCLSRLGIERPLERLTAHPDAPITTPWHMALNRMREISRGAERHGSCGLGIGETMMDVVSGHHFRFCQLGRVSIARLRKHAKHKALIAATLRPPRAANAEWEQCQQIMTDPVIPEVVQEDWYKVSEHVRAVFQEEHDGAVVFEGAQGVLLDENFGYGAPKYVTWSTTTSKNAREIAKAWELDTTVLGVIRAFMTRHGPGPFRTEIHNVPPAWHDVSNQDNPWQGSLRYGTPDLTALYDAAEIDGHLDGLVVTCMDRVEFGNTGPDTLLALYSSVARVPIYATSWGPTAINKACVAIDS